MAVSCPCNCAEIASVIEYNHRDELTESQFRIAQQYLLQLNALLKKEGN